MYDTIFDDFNIIKQHCKRNGNISFDESAVFELLENLCPQYGSANSIQRIIDMVDMQRIRDCKDSNNVIESLNSDKSNDTDSIIEVEVPTKTYAVIDLTENSAGSDEAVVVEKSANQNINNFVNDIESNVGDEDSISDTDNGLLNDYDFSRNFDDDSNLANESTSKSNDPSLLEYLVLLEQPSNSVPDQYDGDQSNAGIAGALEMLEENNNDPNNNLGDRTFDEEPINTNFVDDHNVVRTYSDDTGNSKSNLHSWNMMLDPVPGCSKDSDEHDNIREDLEDIFRPQLVLQPESPVAGCSKDFNDSSDFELSFLFDEQIDNDAICIQEIMSWADLKTIQSLLKQYRHCPNRKQLTLDNLINQENINAVSKRKSGVDTCIVSKKCPKLESVDDIEDASLDLVLNSHSDNVIMNESSNDSKSLKISDFEESSSEAREEKNLPHTLKLMESTSNDLSSISNELKESSNNETLLKNCFQKKNLLLTCQCCFNNECVPTKSSECNKGHTFCHECIIRGTESTLADGEVHVRCFTDCGGEIPLTTLQSVIPPTKFNILRRKREVDGVLAAAVDGLVPGSNDLSKISNELKESTNNETQINILDQPIVTSVEMNSSLINASPETSVKNVKDSVIITNANITGQNSITTPVAEKSKELGSAINKYLSKICDENSFDKQAPKKNPSICQIENANSLNDSQIFSGNLKSDGKYEVIKPAKLIFQRKGPNDYVIKSNTASNSYVKPATFTYTNNEKPSSSKISVGSANQNDTNRGTIKIRNQFDGFRRLLPIQQPQAINRKIENIPSSIQPVRQPILMPPKMNIQSGTTSQRVMFKDKDKSNAIRSAVSMWHLNASQGNIPLKIKSLKPPTLTPTTTAPKEKTTASQMLNNIIKMHNNLTKKNPTIFSTNPPIIKQKPNYTKTEPTATITSASQSRPIPINNTQPSTSSSKSITITGDVPDRSIYNKLRSIFPEVKSSYVKKICIVPPKAVDANDKEYMLNMLIDHLLKEGQNHLQTNQGTIKEQIVATLSVDDKYEHLLQIFTDADPTYLREFVEKNHTEQDYQQFVQQKLESRDYPTKEQYMARIKITEQIKQYTIDFSVEKFLELFPDPFKYFEDPSRNCTYQPIGTEFLKWMFNKNKVNTISRMYTKNHYNLSLTAKSLSEIGPDMKSKRLSYEMPTENIPLMQEMAFLKNKKDIENHLHMLKVKEDQLFKELKEQNLLLTCQCCFNDECVPTKSSECNEGHTFCHECIIRGTESTLADGEAHVRCFTDCKSEIPLATLQSVLPPTKFSTLLKKRQAAEVLAAAVDGLVSCPFCHFASIPPPEDKVFKCLNPECMKETCRQCKELNHVPLKCDEVIKTDKARRLLEEKMTAALLRTCYSCKKQFYKEDGCNKMECSCGALMCYLCDKPIDRKRPYDHFNAQGGANTHLCPLWSDDRLMNAQAVIKVAEDVKNALLKNNPNLKIDTDKLLPKLPPKSRGPHDDIPNANQLPEHVMRVAGAAP